MNNTLFAGAVVRNKIVRLIIFSLTLFAAGSGSANADEEFVRLLSAGNLLAREIYNETRQQVAASLFESTTLINSDDQTAKLTAEQCRIIAHSSFTTVPPSDLPSAAELLSSGRLDQIASPDLRESILGFIQDTV